MTRWLEKLSDAFWEWLDHVMEEPEEQIEDELPPVPACPNCGHLHRFSACGRCSCRSERPGQGGPKHEYARKGTRNAPKLGDACLFCWHKDPKRRPYNDKLCSRPHRPELA